MKSVTFILASLNNGYDDNAEDPVTNYHFKRTLFSANRLKDKFNANVIFVDWCSKEENKYEHYLSKGITYVHVPSLINDELHKNNEATMFFYEWIAKDIGAHFAETKSLIFTNGDNVFSKDFMSHPWHSANVESHWYAGYRLNISNEVFVDEEAFHIAIDTNPTSFNILHECGFCHGDFTFCSKKAYDEIGGYDYSHRHAHEDTVLSRKFELHGITPLHINCRFYHLNHKATGNHFISSEQPINKPYIKNLILKNVKAVIL